MNRQLSTLAVIILAVISLQVVSADLHANDTCYNGGTSYCPCTCQCTPDYRGDQCQDKLPGVIGCADLKEAGRITNGVYNISVEGNSTLVWCDQCLKGLSWLVIQRRINKKLTFYQTSAAYRNGFGSADEEYWIGNKYLHEITYSERYVLRIEVTATPGQTAWAEYDDFRVGHESTNFTLESLGDYSGNAGDAFSPLVGQQFSTYYEHTSSLSCARAFYCGWWFKSLTTSSTPGCANSLLNSQSSIYWTTWTSSTNLRGSVMMIRPHDMSRFHFDRTTTVTSLFNDHNIFMGDLDD